MDVKNSNAAIPYDADIELELLGSLLLKKGLAIPTAAEILNSEDFYKPEHKILFRSILNIFNRNTAPSILSLVEELRKMNALDRVGYSYVLSLGEVAFTTAYVEDHAKIIKDKSVRRQIIKLSEKFQNDAANPAIETAKILSNGEAALRNVSDNSAPSTLITPEYYFSQLITRDIAKNKLYATRTTGFENIDAQQIFSPGLYVIGATPAAGKTTFCWQLLEQLADNGETCIFCSYEMSALELYSKTLSKRLFLSDRTSTLTASEIRRGGYSDALEGLLIELANTKNLKGVNLFEFRDETVDDMLRVIKPYCSDKDKSPVVCLDYLQIVPSIVTDNYSSNRARIDDIVHKLKTFQRETNTTFIVVSSFNRTNYAQQVSFESFKESGNIEYTADVVWAMQLNIVNELKGDNISDARKKIDDAKKTQPRKVQLKCLKNRQGQNYDCYFNYYSAHDYFEACEDLSAVEEIYNNTVPNEF